MFAVAKGGEELAYIEPKGAGRGAKEIQRKTEIVLNCYLCINKKGRRMWSPYAQKGKHYAKLRRNLEGCARL